MTQYQSYFAASELETILPDSFVILKYQLWLHSLPVPHSPFPPPSYNRTHSGVINVKTTHDERAPFLTMLHHPAWSRLSPRSPTHRHNSMDSLNKISHRQKKTIDRFLCRYAVFLCVYVSASTYYLFYPSFALRCPSFLLFCRFSPPSPDPLVSPVLLEDPL